MQQERTKKNALRTSKESWTVECQTRSKNNSRCSGSCRATSNQKEGYRRKSKNKRDVL